MSTVDLDAIRQRNLQAHEEVCGLADGSRKWTMRVPAQPERDSDLVIAAALADAVVLLSEVERLRQLYADHRAVIEAQAAEVTRLRAEVERLIAEVDERDAWLSTLRQDLEVQTAAAFQNQAELSALDDRWLEGCCEHRDPESVDLWRGTPCPTCAAAVEMAEAVAEIEGRVRAPDDEPPEEP